MYAEQLIEKLRSQTLTKDEYNETAELLDAIMADYRKVSRHLSQILNTLATPPPNDHSEVHCDFQPNGATVLRPRS
jgi:uncharacterized membrane-anchored protein YhcB (DUF1043 family)